MAQGLKLVCKLILRYALIFSALNKYSASLCFPFLHRSCGSLIYQKVQVRYQLIHLLLRILIFLLFFLKNKHKENVCFCRGPLARKASPLRCWSGWIESYLESVFYAAFFTQQLILDSTANQGWGAVYMPGKGMKITL